MQVGTTNSKQLILIDTKLDNCRLVWLHRKVHLVTLDIIIIITWFISRQFRESSQRRWHR